MVRRHKHRPYRRIRKPSARLTRRARATQGPAAAESTLEVIGITVSLFFGARLLLFEARRTAPRALLRFAVSVALSALILTLRSPPQESRQDLSDLLLILQDRTGVEFDLGALTSGAKEAAAAAAAAATAATAATASKDAAAAQSAAAEAAAVTAAAMAAQEALRAEEARRAAAAAQAAATAAQAKAEQEARAAAAAAWAVAIAAAAAAAAAPPPPPPAAPLAPAPAAPAPPRAAAGHIVDILAGNPQGIYSVLLEAIERANLTDLLSGPGTFTIFAPSNDAFAKALGVLKLSKDDVLALPNLGAVLQFHVVPGAVRSADVTDGLLVASAQGGPLRFARAGDAIRVNGAGVTTADIAATNGKHVLRARNSVHARTQQCCVCLGADAAVVGLLRRRGAHH